MRGAEDSVGWSLWDRPSPFIQLLFLQLKQGGRELLQRGPEECLGTHPVCPSPDRLPCSLLGWTRRPLSIPGTGPSPPLHEELLAPTGLSHFCSNTQKREHRTLLVPSLKARPGTPHPSFSRNAPPYGQKMLL